MNGACLREIRNGLSKFHTSHSKYQHSLMGIFPPDAFTMTWIQISVKIERQSLSGYEFTNLFSNCLNFKLYQTLTDSSACTNLLNYNGERCYWGEKIINSTYNLYNPFCWFSQSVNACTYID